MGAHAGLGRRGPDGRTAHGGREGLWLGRELAGLPVVVVVGVVGPSLPRRAQLNPSGGNRPANQRARTRRRPKEPEAGKEERERKNRTNRVDPKPRRSVWNGPTAWLRPLKRPKSRSPGCPGRPRRPRPRPRLLAIALPEPAVRRAHRIADVQPCRGLCREKGASLTKEPYRGGRGRPAAMRVLVAGPATANLCPDHDAAALPLMGRHAQCPGRLCLRLRRRLP